MSQARPSEARALSQLAFEELGRAAGGIGGVHRAVADRAFRATGPSALPARRLHDTITRGVYAAVGGGARLAGVAADAALSRRQVAELSTTRRGAAVLAVVNGLRGDALEAENSDLAMGMTVRVAGRPVEAAPAALREAFPGATGRVVVFLHGLMESEHAWELGGRPTYGERLARDFGWTPVYIRYNTGRAVADNGASFVALLDALVREWPAPVRSLALVGHSMGGLVARSACRQAEGSAWPALVRHVVSLGTPYSGAPLEGAVHHFATALARLPETRSFGSFFERRSAGIRDLRRGLADPPLDTACQCYVAAGRDVLVRRPSAVPDGSDLVHHVPGVGHIALLNDDGVYDALRGWLQA